MTPSSIRRILRPGDTGEDVRLLQTATERRLSARDQHSWPVAGDGAYGPQTARAVSRAAWLLGIHGPRFEQTKLANGGVADLRTQEIIRRPGVRDAAMLKRADRRVKEAEKAAASRPLREKAYSEASKLVGIMEQGSNNHGAEVEKLIREGGGFPGQAWCGWFQAAVYKRAGSKAPDWHWGAVRLFVPLSGVSRTSSPKRGDLVRYTFDHIGMFVKDNGNGTITTVEGNTGATGAVSDSATGGDGVYRKVRSKSLVRDYLHITR